MRRVSRNAIDKINVVKHYHVTPRMRRVSRNCPREEESVVLMGHASHEACE